MGTRRLIWILVLLSLPFRNVRCILNKEQNSTLDTNERLNHSSEHFRIEMKPPVHVPGPSETIYFVVTNDSPEDEYVHFNVSDDRGYVRRNGSTEFPLPIGSKREVPVELDFPIINGSVVEHDMDIITVEASGKRNTVTKRSLFLPGSDLEYGGRNAPFCYDRYVTGNCRYRTDPAYCFNYEWTAYAIIQNLGGFGSTLKSIPAGLYVPPFIPGSRERVRVWVKTSCCFPFVEIISSDHHHVCVVDVRELQWLHPGEIAAIVIGIVLLIIIIIVIAVMLLRKRRTQTIVVGHHTRSREHIAPRDRN